MEEEFNPYPELEDKEFNKKIFEKKEFNLSIQSGDEPTVSLDKLQDELCKFSLSPNQQFLSNYINPKTPYNGILLYHGTGVGKTCSSVTIAEGFLREAIEMPIYILLNPSIKASFRKNIFDVNKYKNGVPQCTGSKYPKDLEMVGTKNYELLSKNARKLIKSRYNFLGYIEFANLFEKIKKRVEQKFADDLFESVFLREIDKKFSNSVVIIDEVHNIKEAGKKEDKLVLRTLKFILQNTKNLKLVLLSATPMFNEAPEIIDLVNLLRLNDGRDLIKKRDVFTKGGKFKSADSYKIFIEGTQGYISYLRGEHPGKFPKRLYPNVLPDEQFLLTSENMPPNDIFGERIPEKERIKHLKIVGMPMVGLQLDNYMAMDIPEEGEEKAEGQGSFNIIGMQVSNMVYPNEDTKAKPSENIGIFGLQRMVKRERKKFSWNSPEAMNVFSIENIADYSAKIAKIVSDVGRSEGIVFVYSRFLPSGVIPLALALEMNGFCKYGGSLLKGKKRKVDDLSYLLITGDKELTGNAYEDYLKIENENKNGEKVKVIIGSESAAEGLDFRFIREVHVMDPWYHFNKIEQVIGRAIRNCSHKDLPAEKRNVMVYLYASIVDGSPNETIDLRMYRISERKMKQISDVEFIIKRNAVDCNFNMASNRFIGPYWEKPRKMITSRGNEIMVGLNDEDGSKMCNFKECNYTCQPDLREDDVLNYNTFSYKYVPNNIRVVKGKISAIFSKNIELSESSIIRMCKMPLKHRDLIVHVLNELVKTKEVINDRGVLRKIGKKYRFVPTYLKGEYSTKNNSKRKTRKRVDLLNLRDYKIQFLNEEPEPETNVENIFTTMEKFNMKFDATLRNNLDKQKITEENANNLKANKDLLAYSAQYLTQEDKKTLLDYLLTKKTLSSEEQNTLKLLKKYICKPENEGFNGYKLGFDGRIKYFKLDAGKIVEPTELEIRNARKYVMRVISKEPESSTIMGFLDENKSDKEIVFKIRDKRKEGKKKTQKKTGSICRNQGMLKGKVIDIIEATNNTITKYSGLTKKKIPSKNYLCADLEILFRNFDSEKHNGFRWFYTYEEAIERKIII